MFLLLFLPLFRVSIWVSIRVSIWPSIRPTNVPSIPKKLSLSHKKSGLLWPAPRRFFGYIYIHRFTRFLSFYSLLSRHFVHSSQPIQHHQPNHYKTSPKIHPKFNRMHILFFLTIPYIYNYQSLTFSLLYNSFLSP